MWHNPTTNSGTWAPRALQHSEPDSAAAKSTSTEGAEKGKSEKRALGITDLLEKYDEGNPSSALAAAKKPRFEYPVLPSASSSTSAAAPAAGSDSETTMSEKAAPKASKDDVASAAPRLAEHIKSNAKFVKVAAMAATLLEEGRVTMHNSEAFFEILEAGVADPKRIRAKDFRSAYRRLYSAACTKKELFHPKRQGILRLWHMRVVNQVDLFAKHEDQFARIVKEIRQGLLLLPCLNPSLEPRTRTGAPREHLPESARRMWASAMFECLEVAMTHHKQPWAVSEVNMLIKTAHDRRQNFSEQQAATVAEWEVRRIESSRAERKETERLDNSKRKEA
mmetsp:Transcript_24301/g.53060  ORF Transcript_24301/g.53060 Transcript_24301/m.53060 type:complete len:336 (-) Transcript_24301:265-1272(-)